jgi:hypothetical protein
LQFEPHRAATAKRIIKIQQLSAVGIFAKSCIRTNPPPKIAQKFHVIKTTLTINELQANLSPTPHSSTFWLAKTYGLDHPNLCF